MTPSLADPSDRASTPSAARRSDPSARSRSLASVYQDMPTQRIVRRLAAGGLVPQAEAAARAELARRLSKPDVAAPVDGAPAVASRDVAATGVGRPVGDIPRLDAARLDTPDLGATDSAAADDAQRTGALVMAGLCLAGLVVGWFALPKGLYFMLAALLAPGIAAPIGKRFPRLGMTVGGLLMVLPVGLAIAAWKTGHLAFSRGGDHFMEALIVSGILAFVFAVAWVIGASLIHGARHRGSWAALQDDLDARRTQAIRSMK